MHFWLYITMPTDGRLDPVAGILIILSLFAIAGGICFTILPGLLSSSPRWHAALGYKELGSKEFALR